MPKKSHPDAIATLDFLARVASAYALVCEDSLELTKTPATTWWNLSKICDEIPALPEPRWVTWVNDINDGIWPAAEDSELTDICMAMQSFPSGTLIINFKKLCDARENDKSVVRLFKGNVRQYQLNEHNRHRSDNNFIRLISEENKLVLFSAITNDIQWYDAWLSRSDQYKKALDSHALLKNVETPTSEVTPG